MFVDLDWPLNASSLLSASAELLVYFLMMYLYLLTDRYLSYVWHYITNITTKTAEQGKGRHSIYVLYDASTPTLFVWAHAQKSFMPSQRRSKFQNSVCHINDIFTRAVVPWATLLPVDSGWDEQWVNSGAESLLETCPVSQQRCWISTRDVSCESAAVLSH